MKSVLVAILLLFPFVSSFAVQKPSSPRLKPLSIFKKPSQNPLPSKVPEVITPVVTSADELEENPLKIPFITVWALFIAYAFNLSPPDADPTFTGDVIQKILNTPFDGSVNPIFVAIFNYLGVYPAIFAALLLPGAKPQKVPALPFVFSSFALGSSFSQRYS